VPGPSALAFHQGLVQPSSDSEAGAGQSGCPLSFSKLNCGPVRCKCGQPLLRVRLLRLELVEDDPPVTGGSVVANPQRGGSSGTRRPRRRSRVVAGLKVSEEKLRSARGPRLRPAILRTTVQGSVGPLQHDPAFVQHAAEQLPNKAWSPAPPRREAFRVSRTGRTRGIRSCRPSERPHAQGACKGPSLGVRRTSPTSFAFDGPGAAATLVPTTRIAPA